MTRIIYAGPHTAVTLADGTVAENGKHTEVSDDLAEAYLQREDFRNAPDPKKRKSDAGDGEEE